MRHRQEQEDEPIVVVPRQEVGAEIDARARPEEIEVALGGSTAEGGTTPSEAPSRATRKVWPPSSGPNSRTDLPSKPEPATTHWVADGQAAAFNAPVPARLWMDCPLEMTPVTGLSGTACPLDGSPSSFPTARHCETEGQVTALNFAARNEMV